MKKPGHSQASSLGQVGLTLVRTPSLPRRPPTEGSSTPPLRSTVLPRASWKDQTKWHAMEAKIS